ncbi:MAG: hypothetical protein ACRCWI_01585 [Brevinema sp.]
MFPILIFSQEPLNNPELIKYSNNIVYMTNSLLAFVHKKDLIDKKESITLKKNIMNFSNDQGEFHLNFVFSRDRVTFEQKIDIMIKIYSSNLITPYDGFDQRIDMLVTDQYYTYLWQKDFQFNLREATLTMDKKAYMQLELRKTISNNDFQTLNDLFVSADSLLFFFKGFQGRFEFQFPREIVVFYREFFNYKKEIYQE